MRALDIMMAEYNDLRNEIHQRVNNQLLILGGSVALMAALVAAQEKLMLLAPFSLLGLPVVFAVVAWLYYEQDIFLIHAAKYLHRELRPTIGSELLRESSGPTVNVLRWEDFRGEVLFGSSRERSLLRVMIFFRFVATMGPGVIALMLGMLSVQWCTLSELERYIVIILVSLDLLVTALLYFLSVLVVRMYKEISN